MTDEYHAPGRRRTRSWCSLAGARRDVGSKNGTRREDAFFCIPAARPQARRRVDAGAPLGSVKNRFEFL